MELNSLDVFNPYYEWKFVIKNPKN